MSDTMGGATQTLNAPATSDSTDPALNPPATPTTTGTPTATSADLNPPDVPAALASDPAYNAYLRTMQSQGSLNQSQADEQKAFLRANLASNLPEIQRRGDIATAATKNAYSQRGTLASSWAGNALTQDATNTAQGLSAATDTEKQNETGIDQSLAQSQATQAQGLANQSLTTGVALGSAPGTAGAAANTAATPQVVGPTAAAAGATTTSQSIALEAQKYVGRQYVWGGGHSGDVGTTGAVDCSGLVQQVMQDNGITFTGTAATMQQQAAKVPNLASAQPGDLIFYGMPAYHVGIYIGNGQMVSAEDPADGVKTAPVGTPTSIGRVQGVGPAGAGQLAGTTVAGSAPAELPPPVTQTSPIPGQPDFQVPAALASSPAWLNYMRTMGSTEAGNANAEEAKLAAIHTQYGTTNPAGTQLTPGTVQNQLLAQLPNTLAGTSNTLSQRGTLASSWGQQGLTNDRQANAFAVGQANQTGLGQEMAARQALAQTYSGDQQRLVAQALLQGQALAANPATAGSTANAAATPATPVGNIQTPQDFASALLGALGAPATAANVTSIANWIAREKGANFSGHVGGTDYNPLNTTQDAPGATNWGTQGDIKAYTDWSEGVSATAQTLLNGRYADLVAALKAGGGLGSGHYQSLLTWSGGGYDHI